ncbi:AidA/PixA family protein [Paraherbaspirillum soli]|uniref:AidA/PixA family protein n=1 Tax=Paraherbaspirillum soli TaxID=631222 RepID=A0ABW0MGE2_9BURK
MSEDVVFASSAKSIDILMIFDTEYIKKMYPNPSQGQGFPTSIDRDCGFLLCTGSRGIISGQGSGDLSFRANEGDKVSFMGTSMSDNSGDAVKVSRMGYLAGVNVFGHFLVNTINESGVEFTRFGATVRSRGNEEFYVQFALYTRDGSTQKLFGYYYWSPSIAIAS